MPVIPFDTYYVVDDGKLNLPDIAISFLAYRSDRLEPKLHLNDLLFKNHAEYHAVHDACPSEDILTSWAFRGMEGMRSFGLLDRYAVERVHPPNIVMRFVKDLDKIHAKLSRTDKIDLMRERSRDKASQTNNRKFRRALNVTREFLRRGFSVEEIAGKVAKSVRQVYRRMARLLELGETWESSTDNSVDKSSDMPISPPTHIANDSGISSGSEQAIERSEPRYYAKLSAWRLLITSLVVPDDAWRWFMNCIHPSERAEADKMRSEALTWQRLTDEHNEHLERARACRLERERYDTEHNEPYGSVAWIESVFGVA